MTVVLRPGDGLPGSAIIEILAEDWASIGAIDRPTGHTIIVEGQDLRLRANDDTGEDGTVLARVGGPCFGVAVGS